MCADMVIIRPRTWMFLRISLWKNGLPKILMLDSTIWNGQNVFRFHVLGMARNLHEFLCLGEMIKYSNSKSNDCGNSSVGTI